MREWPKEGRVIITQIHFDGGQNVIAKVIFASPANDENLLSARDSRESVSANIR